MLIKYIVERKLKFYQEFWNICFYFKVTYNYDRLKLWIRKLIITSIMFCRYKIITNGIVDV